MGKTVRVDDQVYAELQRRAKPLEDTANTVLRRLLGLQAMEKETSMSVTPVNLFPSSSIEFKNPEKLASWLLGGMQGRQGKGSYLAASGHYWRNVPVGSVCLFHKDKVIVGEGRVADSFRPCAIPEFCEVTGRPYEGEIRFDPNSLRVYKTFIPFAAAQTLLGKPLSHRGKQGLTSQDYAKIREWVAAHSGYR